MEAGPSISETTLGFTLRESRSLAQVCLRSWKRMGGRSARPLRAFDDYASTHHEWRVDVERINGRPFVNDVSLGVYTEMLGDPGHRRDKIGVAQNENPRRPLRGLDIRRSGCHVPRRRSG